MAVFGDLWDSLMQCTPFIFFFFYSLLLEVMPWYSFSLSDKIYQDRFFFFQLGCRKAVNILHILKVACLNQIGPWSSRSAMEGITDLAITILFKFEAIHCVFDLFNPPPHHHHHCNILISMLAWVEQLDLVLVSWMLSHGFYSLIPFLMLTIYQRWVHLHSTSMDPFLKGTSICKGQACTFGRLIIRSLVHLIKCNKYLKHARA